MKGYINMKKTIKLILLSGCLMATGCGNTSSEMNNTNDNNEEIVVEVVSEDGKMKVLTKELVGVNDDGTYLVKVVVKQGKEEEIKELFCRIDKEGNILNTYENVESMTCFTNGQSIVGIRKTNSISSDEVTLYGVMNPSGKWIIEADYNEIEPLNQNFYTLLKEKFDDFGSLGYAKTVVNNQGDFIIEIEPTETLFLNDTTDFIFYNGQIYSYTGEVSELDLDFSRHYDEQAYGEDYYVLRDVETEIQYYIKPDGSITTYENHDWNKEKINPFNNTYWKWDEDNMEFVYHVNDKATDIRDANSPAMPDTHGRMIVSNNKDESYIACPDGTIVSKKPYKMIKRFKNAGYVLAQELRENHTGGYWVVVDKDGNEVIGAEARIVEVNDDSPVVGIRNEEGNVQHKLLNLYTAEILDEFELMEKFVEALEQ